MWKSACVGIHQLLNWKMHGETLKFVYVAHFMLTDLHILPTNYPHSMLHILCYVYLLLFQNAVFWLWVGR